MTYKQWSKSISLISRGARSQFAVAVALMSLIPLSVIVFLVVEVIPNESRSLTSLHMLTLMVFAVAVQGWFLLFKYPITIMRLRQYLDALGKGEIPHNINIGKGESDLYAIEQCMSRIILQTEDRIRTIELQAKILLEHERQRVVLESLGAACHHLGQPATVLNTSLQILDKQNLSPDMREMVTYCTQSAHDITDILLKLQKISEYKTEPYLKSTEPQDSSKDRILKI